jgi:hypothetical protein
MQPRSIAGGGLGNRMPESQRQRTDSVSPARSDSQEPPISIKPPIRIEPGSPWIYSQSLLTGLAVKSIKGPQGVRAELRRYAHANNLCIFLNETVPKKSKTYRVDESIPQLPVVSDAGYHIFETSIINLIDATKDSALYLNIKADDKGEHGAEIMMVSYNKPHEFNRENLYGLSHPYFWTSWHFWPPKTKKTDTESQCSGFKCVACSSMYPGIDLQGSVEEHVETAVHQNAIKAAIAFHALSAIEKKKNRKHFDLALWYAHHDKVPHECLAMKVVDDFIKGVKIKLQGQCESPDLTKI